MTLAQIVRWQKGIAERLSSRTSHARVHENTLLKRPHCILPPLTAKVSQVGDASLQIFPVSHLRPPSALRLLFTMGDNGCLVHYTKTIKKTCGSLCDNHNLQIAMKKNMVKLSVTYAENSEIVYRMVRLLVQQTESSSRPSFFLSVSARSDRVVIGTPHRNDAR